MSEVTSNTITFTGTAKELIDIAKQVENAKGDFDFYVINPDCTRNCYGSEKDIDLTEDGPTLSYHFFTKPFPPFDIFEYLAQKFPTIEFTAYCRFESGGYAEGNASNGKFDFTVHDDDDSPDNETRNISYYNDRYIYIAEYDWYMKVMYVEFFGDVDGDYVCEFNGFAFNNCCYDWFCRETSIKLTKKEYEKLVETIDIDEFMGQFLYSSYYAMNFSVGILGSCRDESDFEKRELLATVRRRVFERFEKLEEEEMNEFKNHDKFENDEL